MKPEPIEIEDSPPRPGQVVQLKKPKQVVAEPPKEASTAGIPLLTSSGDVAGGDGATPAPAGNSMLRRANAYDEKDWGFIRRYTVLECIAIKLILCSIAGHERPQQGEAG